MLALRAVQNLTADQKPVILGGGFSPSTMLEGYPVTSITEETEPFTFDRSQHFGFENRLDYSIIVRWVAAEHKSQGTVQSTSGQGTEQYYIYDINPENAWQKANEFFEAVNAAEIYF